MNRCWSSWSFRHVGPMLTFVSEKSLMGSYKVSHWKGSSTYCSFKNQVNADVKYDHDQTGRNNDTTHKNHRHMYGSYFNEVALELPVATKELRSVENRSKVFRNRSLHVCHIAFTFMYCIIFQDDHIIQLICSISIHDRCFIRSCIQS